jgi:hypothetical protein
VKYRQILKCRPADLNNKYIGNYKNTDLPTWKIISANVKVPTCSPNIIIGTFKSAHDGHLELQLIYVKKKNDISTRFDAFIASCSIYLNAHSTCAQG